MASMIVCIVFLIGCAKDVIETDLETDCDVRSKKVVDHWDWRLYDEFDNLIDSGKDYKITQMAWSTKECLLTSNFTTSKQNLVPSHFEWVG
jgi:putative IMPACT (imprinted ancient) family translation regulator